MGQPPSIDPHPAGAENTTFKTLLSLKKTSKYSGNSHSQTVSYRQSFVVMLVLGSPRFFETSSFEEPRCSACQFPNPSDGSNHLLSASFSSLACIAGFDSSSQRELANNLVRVRNRMQRRSVSLINEVTSACVALILAKNPFAEEPL